MEKQKSTVLKSSREEVKSSASSAARPLFNAGLARIIDRQRHSYQELAAKTAAVDEQLAAVTAASDVELASQRRMVDASVQSDHAVDTRRPREKAGAVTAGRPGKVDKATQATDDSWPQGSMMGFVDVIAEETDDEEMTTVTTTDPHTAR